MELIKANNLNLNNGTKDILIDASFRVLEGDKIGLIGPNGVGKTTLVRLLLGEISADSGTLYRRKSLNIGYMPQQPEMDESLTIEEFLLADLTPVTTYMQDLEERMAKVNQDELEPLLTEYQYYSDKFEQLGGYSALDRGESIISRLGLKNKMDQEISTLSGGERSMIFLSRIVMNSPDLIILDEPGNHLDFLGLAWLEKFIEGYRGAVIVISHNRYLLDRTCSQLFDMSRGKLTTFRGNYSALRLEKYRTNIIEQNLYDAAVREEEMLKKKIKELQSIAMSQYNPPASVMAQLGAAKKRLADLLKDKPEKPDMGEDRIHVDLGKESSKSDIAVEVNDFTFGFEDNILFEKANLQITCREKVALVGPNGVGKSSFIKVLLENGDWDSFTLRLGPSQVVGYLSQEPEFDKEALTVSDEIRSWGEMTGHEVFSIAKRFYFTLEDLDKPIKVLSGGECNRLQLARLIYFKTNFLILDEPTNHMDIQSREVIEEAVKNFPGTVLVISHDRYFLDQLVDRVVEISDKNFVSWEGNFSSYFKKKYPVLPKVKSGERKAQKIDLSTKEIEERIEQYEADKVKLEHDLKAVLDKKDHKNGRKLAVKLEKLNSLLDKLYNQL